MSLVEKVFASKAQKEAEGKKLSLLEKHLTKEVAEELKDKKTSLGATLDDVIRSGAENTDSGVGIYAPDPESYTTFQSLFDAVIADYHKESANFKQPQVNYGDLSYFANLDPKNEYVVSTRIRCARSVEGSAIHGATVTEADYKNLEDKIVSGLKGLTGELAGTYYPLAGMDKATQDQLTADHFLFKEGDRFLGAAGACKYWPTGRGIYHNPEKNFLVWVNEEDHIRIISMQMGADVAAVYKRWMDAVEALNKSIKFARTEKHGFLTFCPTNIGTGIRASVHIRLPHLGNEEQLKAICEPLGLQVRGIHGEHSESADGIYDISNKRRLGVTEFEAVKIFYDGIKTLIEKERAAAGSA